MSVHSIGDFCTELLRLLTELQITMPSVFFNCLQFTYLLESTYIATHSFKFENGFHTMKRTMRIGRKKEKFLKSARLQQ